MGVFTIQEVLEITGARVLSGQDPRRLRRKIRRLCTDSRQIRPGDLFVALTGESFDGHDFVDSAFSRGAVGAIVQAPPQRQAVSRKPRVSQTEGPSLARAARVLVEVPDTLRAYQDLATHHRARFRFPVVAVTGSNGKTTTKEMIALVLAQRRSVVKTEGNLNNRIGVPQTLLRITSRHQAAVVEMGVDRLGQTTRLCEIVRPTIGIITNVGPDHLESFGSLDASAQAKAELVDLMPPTGALVLNADDPYFEELASRAACEVLPFGLSGKARVRAFDIAPDARRGVGFRLILPGRTKHPLVVLKAYGTHNVYNALAAAAVGHVLGLTGTAIARGLGRFQPASMRSQVLTRDGIQIINDCYNANPASMRAAIELLADLGASKRTIAVLGDMLELGSESVALHREVGERLAGLGVGHLIASGSLGRHIAAGALAGGMPKDRVQETPDAQEAARVLLGLLRVGDVVLVKASRGMRMERVIEALGKVSEPPHIQGRH